MKLGAKEIIQRERRIAERNRVKEFIERKKEKEASELLERRTKIEELIECRRATLGPLVASFKKEREKAIELHLRELNSVESF